MKLERAFRWIYLVCPLTPLFCLYNDLVAIGVIPIILFNKYLFGCFWRAKELVRKQY